MARFGGRIFLATGAPHGLRAGRRRAGVPFGALPLAGALALALAVAACGGAGGPTGAASGAAGRGEPAAELEAAVRAFERYDVAASRAHYRAVLADPRATRPDRVTALRALARFAWQFDDDLAAARAALEAALEHAHEVSAVWSQRGGIELEAGHADRALTAAVQARETAAGDSERTDAALLWARARLADDRRQIAQGRPVDPAGLRRAADALGDVLERRPGHPEASDALLGVAILSDDGPLALEAWKSYFWIAGAEQVPATLRAPFEALTGLAPRWRSSPLSDPDRAALALALARSRFFEYAAMVARPLPRLEPELAEAVAYHAFAERVAAVNRSFYPRIARGLREYADAYDAAIYEAAKPLWAALRRDGAPFEPDAFFERIRDRFGAEGYLGTTVNFYGMLMGHVIQDERRQVEQYGYASEFRYVLIDRPLSRDFTSWYGTTNVGGWGTESAMVQVRSAYTADPFTRLSWVTDPRARAKAVAEIERARRDDLVACAKDPHAEPASLPALLKLEASEQIYARLAAAGLRGRALALAFVAETLRLNVEATVFAHEGRHALDQRHFAEAFARMDDEEREWRAKLSEVAFSSSPKLALTGSIIGGRLDERSGHGRANKRFRRLLVDWMQAHRHEIAGLDDRVPLILQVNRLRDDQIVGLVRAADPLAAAPRR